MNTQIDTPVAGKRRGFSGLQVVGIAVLAIAITALAAAWIVKRYILPAEFRPVELSTKEERVLDTKLKQLGVDIAPVRGASGAGAEEMPLEPEAYSEDASARDIYFGERELNALLARNTNLASRLAIDLSDNLASAKLLVPMADDFPVLGGKTIRVNTGVEVSFAEGRPIVVLKGVSIMGVPIPNAWLGNLKNVDLVREFGASEGFWRTLAEGIELIEVSDGQLHLTLKE